MNICRFTFVVIIMLMGVDALSQKSRKIEQFSVSDGLSAGSVLSITQDAEGYLWVGTILGLNRYDGKKFTSFFHDPSDNKSLSGNTVACLSVDPKGDLWVGTDGGGVCRFNKYNNNFERFDIPKKGKNSKDNNRIWALTADKKGNIWVGSYGDGLSMIEAGTGKVCQIMMNELEDKSSSLLLQDILCDSSGILWIATDGTGIIRYDPVKKQSKAFLSDPEDPATLSHNYVSRIKNAGGGIFWITTYGRGVCKFDSRSGKFIRLATKLIDSCRKSENEIWSALYEPDGTLWLGYWGRGLGKYNTRDDEVEFVGEPSGKGVLGSNIILSIYRDRSGVLWVGTSEGGLNKITDGKLEEFQINSSKGRHLQGNTFCRLQDGRIFVGTDQGLYLYNSDMTLSSEINPGAFDKKITSIEKYGGNYWVGTFGGGTFVLNESFNVVQHYRRGTQSKAMSSDDITKIFVGRDSTLWIGTFGEGLNKYEPETGTFSTFKFSENSLIPQDHDKITDIKEIDSHRLIISTFSYGLCIFDRVTGSFQEIKPTDKDAAQLPFKIIYSMIVDNTNTAWCATLGGVLKVNLSSNTSESVPFVSSVNKMSFFSVLEADNDYLLLIAPNAIYRFNKKNHSLMPLSFLKNSVHKSFIPAASFRFDDLIFCGTDKGFITVNPDEFAKSSNFPQFTISDVRVNDLPVKYQEVFFKGEEFVLAGDDKRLQLVLSVFDFQESSSYTLLYRLEGFDDKWMQIEPGVPVVYSNLPPGSYKFKYRLENTEGVAEEGKVLLLELRPPFYQTWWFLFLTVSLLISGSLYLANSRIQGIKRQRDIQREYSNLLIESQESERKRISAELHDSIGQDLAVIKNIAVLQTQKSNGVNDREQLDLLIEVCTEAIEDVRKIAYDLRPYQLGKIGLTKAVEHLIEMSKKAVPVKFELELENIDNLLSEKGELHIYRILQECLSNSLKYANAGTISLKINKTTGGIFFEYLDDGSGFSISKEKTLNEKGGLGLMDIRERSNLLSADFNIFSEPGKGFCLQLNIPVLKEKNG